MSKCHPEKTWVLDTSFAVKVLARKKNWSAPGPDRLLNFWWKRAHVLHEGVVPRDTGGRGLRSVDMEYKATKLKSAVRLYCNEDPAIQMVREFEERAEEMGRRSMA